MKNNYISIKLPEGIINEVQNVIKKKPELGYTNRTQLITDAVRRRLEELTEN